MRNDPIKARLDDLHAPDLTRVARFAGG